MPTKTRPEQNELYAKRLGWSPADFGKKLFDDSLVSVIAFSQKLLGTKDDGVCGPATYGLFLADRQARLLKKTPLTLEDAGVIALCVAKQAWLQNISDLPPANDPGFEKSRMFIDNLIRTPMGINWTWESLYTGNFEWCGTLPAYAWRVAGMKLALRTSFFPSTYRLDRWARYQALDNTPNPKPPPGQHRRMLVELDEHSKFTDARFGPDLPPRAGDILLIGGASTAYGKHICLVESYDEVQGVFTTIEGNGTGAAPDGSLRHGIVRGRRIVALRQGSVPTTYHARRLIRPAPIDLSLTA